MTVKSRVIKNVSNLAQRQKSISYVIFFLQNLAMPFRFFRVLRKYKQIVCTMDTAKRAMCYDMSCFRIFLEKYRSFFYIIFYIEISNSIQFF